MNEGIKKARETANKIKGEVKAKEVKKAKPSKKIKVEKAVEIIEQVKPVEEVKPPELINGQLILTPKHKELIKNQIAKNATKEELELFFMMAYRTRLDPLMKQLYFIKYGQGDRAKVSYVTSIDGYRIIAHRSGQFTGIDEPKYKYTKNGDIYSCSITVWKKGSEHGFSATVVFSEYTTGKNLWSSKPLTMIAKVAEAHALRKAFPHDLSGIYTTDEMDQAGLSKPPKPQNKLSNNTVKMITKPQVSKIKELMEQKNVDVESLKQNVKKAYKRDSLIKMSMKQAGHLIGKLQALPDRDDAFLDMAEEALVGESMPENDIDMDEVDDGIKQQQLDEEGV